MNYIHIPPIHTPPALIAQVLQTCGSYGPGGDLVTPFTSPSGLGCSAPVGDGGSGYVRIVPQQWRGPGAVGVEPDRQVIPRVNSYPGIVFPDETSYP